MKRPTVLVAISLLALAQGCKQDVYVTLANPYESPLRLFAAGRELGKVEPGQSLTAREPNRRGAKAFPADRFTARVATPCGEQDVAVEASPIAAGELGPEAVLGLSSSSAILWLDNSSGPAGELKVGRLSLAITADETRKRMIPVPTCEDGRELKLDGEPAGKLPLPESTQGGAHYLIDLVGGRCYEWLEANVPVAKGVAPSKTRTLVPAFVQPIPATHYFLTGFPTVKKPGEGGCDSTCGLVRDRACLAPEVGVLVTIWYDNRGGVPAEVRVGRWTRPKPLQPDEHGRMLVPQPRISADAPIRLDGKEVGRIPLVPATAEDGARLQYVIDPTGKHCYQLSMVNYWVTGKEPNRVNVRAESVIEYQRFFGVRPIDVFLSLDRQLEVGTTTEPMREFADCER